MHNRNLTKNELKYIWKTLNKKRIFFKIAFPELVILIFLIYLPIALSLNKSERFFVVNCIIFAAFLLTSIIFGITINIIPKKFLKAGQIRKINGKIKLMMRANGYSFDYYVNDNIVIFPSHLFTYGFLKEDDYIELECWEPDIFLLQESDVIALSVNGKYQIDKDIKNGILRKKNSLFRGVISVSLLIVFTAFIFGFLIFNNGYKKQMEYLRYLKYNFLKKPLVYEDIEEFLNKKPEKYREFKIKYDLLIRDPETDDYSYILKIRDEKDIEIIDKYSKNDDDRDFAFYLLKDAKIIDLVEENWDKYSLLNDNKFYKRLKEQVVYYKYRIFSLAFFGNNQIKAYIEKKKKVPEELESIITGFYEEEKNIIRKKYFDLFAYFKPRIKIAIDYPYFNYRDTEYHKAYIVYQVNMSYEKIMIDHSVKNNITYIKTEYLPALSEKTGLILLSITTILFLLSLFQFMRGLIINSIIRQRITKSYTMS